MNYTEFLEQKKHTSGQFGFKASFIPDFLFPFQKYIVEKAVKKGRIAIYADTGLGKTAIQLSIAENIVREKNKRVLILTPLAVAFQFLLEAEKVGISNIKYSKDGTIDSKIIVANYERLHYFNSEDFGAVILDESSILKNFDGAIKNKINTFIKRVKYRFLLTATPSPNDFIELGTSSEALGYLGYTDMLGRFFTNNEDTVSPQNIGTKWRLKGHAQEKFFEWVSSWSISLRKPSDLGFSDENYKLPELIINDHSIKNKRNLIIDGQMQMFNLVAKRLQEVREENKSTIKERCEKAAEISSKKEISVYWCNRNDEGDLLEKLDPDAYQIKGSMPIEKKEEYLVAFAKGEIKKLITKAKITGFGLNWQHCNHTVYFPDFSYEKYYQAIRRFWRFGQKNDVVVDRVFSDGQKRVIDSLEAKSKKANELFSKLNLSINSDYTHKQNGFDKKITKPKFL